MKKSGFKPIQGCIPQPSVQFEDVCPLIQRAAAVRLAAAVATGTATPQDCEDLEQEALLAAWRALRSFDPSRASLRTFIERVVAARFASLMRARRKKPTPEPIQEHHLIGLDGIPAVEFRVDFQTACASLGKADRRLATLLSPFSPTEASRTMGISRSTVYEGIRRIRVAFENAGYCLGTGRGR